MRKIEHVVLHCSATRAIQDIGAKEIKQWHTTPKPRGNGWADIGYHFVIRRDGTLENGRDVNRVGAHVANHNSRTIGVCLVGGLANKAPYKPEDNFTPAQWATLKTLLTDLSKTYTFTVLGHRDFPGVAKACPCFDARTWAKKNGFTPAPKIR
jgi:N-acetylmuramoyl-L-alanine amidase